MSPRALALAATLATVLAAAGCSSSTTSSGPTRAAYSFDCCKGMADAYHPGETVVLRWIRRPASYTTTAAPTAITLTATLDGVYPDAAAAKAAGMSASPGPTQLQGTAHVTDATTTTPVTRLHIPADTAPGIYNLTTTIEWAHGESESATGSLRITAR